MIYEKDKDTRITVRMNSQMFAYLKYSADLCNCSPAEFLRRVIKAAMLRSPVPLDEEEEEMIAERNVSVSFISEPDDDDEK